jgi:hypothetical protein
VQHSNAVSGAATIALRQDFYEMHFRTVSTQSDRLQRLGTALAREGSKTYMPDREPLPTFYPAAH